jgi:hypothetical protein
VQELRAFSSLLYSKNKALAALDWHPKKKGMLAVAPTRNLNFNQKMDIDGMVRQARVRQKVHEVGEADLVVCVCPLAVQVSTAYILVWDFVDFSSPQFLLQVRLRQHARPIHRD